MTGSPDLLLLMAGVVAILLVATFIGQALRMRHSADGGNPVVENLNARILSWWGMVALLGLAFLAGRIGVIVLFALCSFAALREFLTLTNTTRADHWALVTTFFGVLPAQYWLVWADWYGFYSIFIPVFAFLLLPIIAALRGSTEGFLTRVSETQWGLMIAVFCVSHVPALLTLDIPGFEGRNVILIAWLVFVVQLSDIVQFACGKLFGRRLVAPLLSPSKTWEGLVGGVLIASLAGASLWWMTPFTLLEAFGIGVLVTVIGFCGGLVMSAIKRDRGVKDWGHLFEGHGGFIDRLDSVMFAAPVFFHVIRHNWTMS